MAEPISFPALIQGGWRDMHFEPFREGVEICRLVAGEPEVALLRYAAGASVPPHLHHGLETVFVLDGEQSDERGTYRTGALTVNPAGFVHSVASEAGCVVLIQWTKPVEIL
jgi:anti-sigma factor ChrR (cupin superfamily)